MFLLAHLGQAVPRALFLRDATVCRDGRHSLKERTQAFGQRTPGKSPFMPLTGSTVINAVLSIVDTELKYIEWK